MKKLYDKGEGIQFPIVNFPFICSNIPAAPAYGVYISKLIRYSRARSSNHDFLDIWATTNKIANETRFRSG
jgi:hypothetical protein